MTEIVVDLPWPPSKLSPNSRTHWRSKATLFKRYKLQVAMLAGPKLVGQFQPTQLVALGLEFIAPDKRRRDDDNLIGAFKAGRDGLAMAAGMDDSQFRMQPPPRISEQTIKGGVVRVTLRGIADAAKAE